jgi:hypothetical protein
MAITITPKMGTKIEGRNDAPQKFEWWIRGSNDYAAVMIAFAGYLDPVFNFNKVLRDFKATQQAPGLFIGEAEYKMPTPSDPEYKDSPNYRVPIQFELGGHQQKLTHSLETTGRYSSDYDSTNITGSEIDIPPDHKQAVNVTRDKVEGYEFEFPTFTWSEKHMLHNDIVNADYRKALLAAFNKVNESEFRDFPEGAVRFCGVSGGTSEKYFDFWEMTFKFECSEKREDIEIGDIVPFDKEPWDLLWVLYDNAMDDDAKRHRQIPRYAYTERVFDSVDFSTLQLPA